MRVVVIYVFAEDQLQMPLAGDQHPVQALAASAAHPALRDRVRPRRLDRRLDDPHADRGEHRIEPNGEHRIPVTDQEFQAVSTALEVHQQIAGLLGHPLPRRVSGDPGQVHTAGAVLDEEQDLQAPQKHGVDMEEVDSEDRRGLTGQERPPGLPCSSGRGIDARVLEDLPHRRRSDCIPQAGQLAVDASVPPDGLSRAISSTSARMASAVLGRP